MGQEIFNKLISSVQNIYYSLEDKWYDILDKVDTKIPIYKIIDPIDKFVPSFVLFLLFLFFIIILIGYLIRFSYPYEVTFTISDASTNAKLSGVFISGAINENDFKSVITNSSGIAKVETIGPKNNLYDLISSILFGNKDVFSAQLSIEKEGYVSWKNKNILLESKNYEISLEKVPVAKAILLGKAQVELYDKSTSQKIIDLSNSAYLKYDCKNIEIYGAPILVKDDDDGVADDVFTLTEENCEFIITEASAPNYVPLGSATELDPTQANHIIELIKQAPNEGTASVFVYETKNSTKVALSGIKVTFNKTNLNDFAYTNYSGIAEKVLSPGEYFITILDENHLPITIESNKIIQINKGERSTIEIELIPSSNIGMVYLKVVDVNNVPLNQAEVTILHLQKDSNNNYFGATEKNKMVYSLGRTDSNGLFQEKGYLLNSEAKILGIVKKSSSNKKYLTEIFFAKVVKFNESYQIVVLKEANRINSGFATINVKENDTNLPLYRASAYLYYSTFLESTNISNIPINVSGILTDKVGKAEYEYLIPGEYSAGADIGGKYFSGIVGKKDIDANEHVDFNVFINMNASLFNFKLIDAITGNEILGSVDLYYINQKGGKEFLETISTKTGGYYKSTIAFRTSDNLLIVGKSSNYANSILYLGGNHSFEEENNYYNLKLYQNSVLDNNNTSSGQGNGGANKVNIFFENVYSIGNKYWEGVSTIDSLEEGKEYSAVFNIVLNGNVTYNELLSMVRITGAGQAINTRPGLVGEPRISQKIYDCNTTSLDSLTRVQDDNYYLPSTNCVKSNNSKFIQAGFNWKNNVLEKGTYTMVVDFNVDLNSNGENLLLHYRAKEKDTNGTSQTALLSRNFVIGQIFNQGIYFSVNSITSNEQINLKEGPTQTSNQLKILNTTLNKLKISITNNTNQSISNATLVAYSHTGNSSSFNDSSSGSGAIYFDSNKTIQKINVATGIDLGQYLKSNEFDLNISMNENRSSWLVLVLMSGNTAITKVFINLTSNGREMKLKDYCFLAGVPNQNLFLTIMPKYGTDSSLVIKSADLKIYEDCDLDNGLIETIPTFSNLSSDTLSTILDKSYEYQKDCIKYQIYGKSNNYLYGELTGTIRAGSCGAIDPELSCINIDLNGNSPLELLKMDWNKKVDLKVSNNCSKSIDVVIESGLLCKVNNEDCSEKITIQDGNYKNFEIISVNKNYNPELIKPNFSDVLGYYPIYIKAKLSEKSTKNYSIAKTAKISVYNSKQCFAISKDYFDFISKDTDSFVINNDCNYSLIGNYYIPKATLNSFGYDINLTKPSYNQISFRPKLVFVTNGSFDRVSSFETITTYGEEKVITPENGTLVEGKEYNKYSNLRFDFTNEKGISDWIQIKYFDKNNYVDLATSPATNTPYGASIDGNIKITYSNGNVVFVTPQRNFDINTHPTCTSETTPECIIYENDSPENELNENPNNQGAITGGLLYVNLLPPYKDINFIEFSVIGNKDNIHLTIHVKSHLIIDRNYEKLVYNSTSSQVQDVNLTNNNLTIYAREGIEFAVKKVNELELLKGTNFVTAVNPTIYLDSGNPLVSVWIQGDLLMAKFVGTDVSQFNDGSIESGINKDYAQGSGLGLVDVTDYVFPKSGKVISGE